VQMPDMDGFEVAQWIRSSEQGEQLPIIFVTAIDRGRQYEFAGYEAGAVDFLFKPIDERILQSKVAGFLRFFRQRQLLERQAVALAHSNAEMLLEPNTVKVDRQLVNGAKQDRRKQKLLRRLVALVRALGCEIIAEGVERPEDAELLRQLEVCRAQGYLWSKPQAMAALVSKLRGDDITAD